MRRLTYIFILIGLLSLMLNGILAARLIVVTNFNKKLVALNESSISTINTMDENIYALNNFINDENRRMNEYVLALVDHDAKAVGGNANNIDSIDIYTGETKELFKTMIDDEVTDSNQLFQNRKNFIYYRRKSINKVPASFPIPTNYLCKITSHFGARIDPFTGMPSFHYGIDIGGQEGTPILGAADGKVVDGGYKWDLGKFVRIRHESGWITTYAHMRRISVNINQKVLAGQKVGEMGSTGDSTGSHLHYAIQNSEGDYLDPLEVISNF